MDSILLLIGMGVALAVVLIVLLLMLTFIPRKKSDDTYQTSADIKQLKEHLSQPE